MQRGAGVPFVDLEPQLTELRPELDRAWKRVTTAGRFVGGPEVERFETRWAAACGVRAAVGVANGTDALHLTLRALGIGAGDEVIVPANTFVATAEAVALAGATPRFVDVDPQTLVVTAATVAPAITPRTAALIAVHLYGHTPDMDELAALTSRSKIALIEDAAQAHGAAWRGRPVGSLGDAACFSFYPSKNLGANGDGGAVTSDDVDLIARIRSIGDHGRDPARPGDHVHLGTNSRLDALQAAILDAKLDRLPDWNEARRRIARRYRDLLEPSGIEPVRATEGSLSVHHLLVVRVPHRERLRALLDADGVATGVHYPVPCHLLAPFDNPAYGRLPEAERAADEIVSLPMFPHMSEEQVQHVSASIETAMSAAAV